MILRALTYNIHGARGTDGRRDYARIGEFLRREKIDVALLQEVDTRPGRGGREAVAQLMTDRFSTIAPGATIETEDGWYGNALLTRFPITRMKTIDISEPGREPRNILEAFVDTPLGPLHVVNTHKGLGALERSKQIGRLTEMLQTESDVPLLVGGDINQWHRYSKALRKLDGCLQPQKSAATFPTMMPVFHLDRMWCRPRGLIRQVQVLKTPETRVYSDHYPVLATIQLG